MDRIRRIDKMVAREVASAGSDSGLESFKFFLSHPAYPVYPCFSCILVCSPIYFETEAL